MPKRVTEYNRRSQSGLAEKRDPALRPARRVWVLADVQRLGSYTVEDKTHSQPRFFLGFKGAPFGAVDFTMAKPSVNIGHVPIV
ncbi:hypothetical protein CCQ62_23505 [Salmonella enterica]|nr:hypothetical protein [Salmonella enterica]